MVGGFDSFKEWFKGFDEQYVIIGGTACDLLISDQGGNFRATRDIDMVLIVEAVTAAFGQRFWEFIQVAEYEHQNKSKNMPQYYRFSHPKSKEYPTMIELFSRKADTIQEKGDHIVTPFHIDEEVSSLSAILLNDAYYQFMRDGKILIDGIPIIGATHIIPFKMKAWIDLTSRQLIGESVDSKDIRKHKNDVFRLAAYITGNEIVDVSREIYQDIIAFCEAMNGEKINMKQLGLTQMTKENVLEIYKKIYQIQHY